MERWLHAVAADCGHRPARESCAAAQSVITEMLRLLLSALARSPGVFRRGGAGRFSRRRFVTGHRIRMAFFGGGLSACRKRERDERFAPSGSGCEPLEEAPAFRQRGESGEWYNGGLRGEGSADRQVTGALRAWPRHRCIGRCVLPEPVRFRRPCCSDGCACRSWRMLGRPVPAQGRIERRGRGRAWSDGRDRCPRQA